MSTSKPPSTHKFAVLLTAEESPDLPTPVPLRPGLELRMASLEELAGDYISQWRGMIGELNWQVRNVKRLVCVNVARTQRPDTHDGEHHELTVHCRRVWYAYQLARPRFPAYGKCVHVEGHATERDGVVTLGQVGGWKEEMLLIRPWYVDLDDFPYVNDSGWPTRLVDCWRLIEGALDVSGVLPPLTDQVLDSYSSALCLGGTNHRLPYFVRAAEGVLALPRGPGEQNFVTRALPYLQNVQTAPFVASHDVEPFLREVFRLRNACVHGKDPAAEYAGRLDLVPRLEYLAETLANETTRWALRQHAFLRTKTRAQLEAEWAGNNVPPP